MTTPLSAGALRAMALFSMLTSACTAGGGGGTIRTYYITAENVDWDYAPTGTNLITGGPLSQIDSLFFVPQSEAIGRVYRKAVYREYTDSTFSTPKPRTPEWEHLGMLGPLIRGVVGDTIKVVFRNRADRAYSVHPHGVFYNKDSEGAPYADASGDSNSKDDGVPPGGTHVYVWPVPERAGPAPGEKSSVIWMYHSHTHEEQDVNAGLIGPMVVTAAGKARADGSPTDVDREFVVAFLESDENVSWYFEHNVTTYAKEPAKVPRLVPFSDFHYITNLRESMNGFSLGHLKGLTMQVGDRVRWYVFANSNFEMHAPHWHGQTVVANHMRTDVLSLTTMEMVTADMVPDNPGTWLFHCHVAPHQLGGMLATFTVQPRD
jgi:FtsP/CotA-like multicopper oxidase with cupredoxin domain